MFCGERSERSRDTPWKMPRAAMAGEFVEVTEAASEPCAARKPNFWGALIGTKEGVVHWAGGGAGGVFCVRPAVLSLRSSWEEEVCGEGSPGK